MRKSLFLSLVLVLSGPVYGKDKQGTPAPQAFSICTVLSNPAEYDGKEITVRGIYQFEIHGSEFWGRDCVSRDKMVNMRAANVEAHKQFSKRMRKLPAHRPVDMVVRGRFWIAQEGRCFGGPACDLYEIEETELLWVQSIQDDSKSGEKSGSAPLQPGR